MSLSAMTYPSVKARLCVSFAFLHTVVIRKAKTLMPENCLVSISMVLKGVYVVNGKNTVQS